MCLKTNASLQQTERNFHVDPVLQRDEVNITISIASANKVEEDSELILGKDNTVCNSYIARSSFPFVEFIVACGFFLIYFVEEFIKSSILYYQKFTTKSFDCRTEKSEKIDRNNSLILTKLKTTSITELEKISTFTDTYEMMEIKSTDDKKVFYNSSEDSFSKRTSPLQRTAREEKKSIKNINFFYGQSDMKELNIEGLEDFITILALSFNSVFEGFAAGFQHSEISTWMLFVSIALHKYVSVFVISAEALNKGSSTFRVILYVFMFSIMSPLSMFSAIVAHKHLSETRHFEITILNTLSVGTMLYITFFEMLKQRKGFVEISGFAQFFVLLAGFIVMSTIEYFYTRVE